MNSQSENSTQQNSAMDMLRKKNTRTLSELEQIPYQPQVYAIPIEQRTRESKLLADAVEFQPKLYQLIEQLATAERANEVIARLFVAYQQDSALMPDSWRVGLPDADPQRSRHIADFIAGMTDRFAIDQYARIYGEQPQGLSNV